MKLRPLPLIVAVVVFSTLIFATGSSVYSQSQNETKQERDNSRSTNIGPALVAQALSTSATETRTVCGHLYYNNPSDIYGRQLAACDGGTYYITSDLYSDAQLFNFFQHVSSTPYLRFENAVIHPESGQFRGYISSWSSVVVTGYGSSANCQNTCGTTPPPTPIPPAPTPVPPPTPTPVPGAQAPAAPSNLRVSSNTNTSITLSWQDNSDTERGFYIYRWNGSIFDSIGRTDPNVTTFTDSGLQCDTGYSYEVSAYNNTGKSSRAGTDGRTAACPPPPSSGSAQIKVTNFTLADTLYPGDISRPTIKTYRLRHNILWIEVSNTGDRDFNPPTDGGQYVLQVLLKTPEGLQEQYEYTPRNPSELEPFGSIPAHQSRTTALTINNLFLWHEVKSGGTLEVFLMPDRSLGQGNSILDRAIVVDPNPVSGCACAMDMAASLIGLISLNPELGPAVAARLEAGGLATDITKDACNRDPKELYKDIAADILKILIGHFTHGSIHEAGELLKVGVDAAKHIGEAEPACANLPEFLNAWMYQLLSNHVKIGSVFTESPVYPLVVNSAGQRAGFMQNGQPITEISESQVATIGEKRIILFPGDGDVQLSLFGYANGTMNIHTAFTHPDGSGDLESYVNVPVAQGMIATLSSADVKAELSIDTNRDGQVDNRKSPDIRETVNGPQPPSPSGGGGSYTFKETGFGVSGRIWQMWQNGHSYDDSLYINGFPITSLRSEINATDGKIYQTQWFERARFELHPQNQPPYDVLFGLLGTDIARSRQNEAPFKVVGSPGGGIPWFQETQHTLGDNSEGGKAIAAFWNNLGGLQQFGFPLSQPFMETSKDDGKIYLVQYFERQRFEYHPENKGSRYEVLLGRLGAEQRTTSGAPQSGKIAGGPFLNYFNQYGGVQIFGNPISDELNEVSTFDGRRTQCNTSRDNVWNTIRKRRPLIKWSSLCLASIAIGIAIRMGRQGNTLQQLLHHGS